MVLLYMLIVRKNVILVSDIGPAARLDDIMIARYSKYYINCLESQRKF